MMQAPMHFQIQNILMLKAFTISWNIERKPYITMVITLVLIVVVNWSVYIGEGGVVSTFAERFLT